MPMSMILCSDLTRDVLTKTSIGKGVRGRKELILAVTNGVIIDICSIGAERSRMRSGCTTSKLVEDVSTSHVIAPQFDEHYLQSPPMHMSYWRQMNSRHVCDITG